MFGYIRIHKPELTFREYEQYRSIYCSLCEALGQRYGLAARMTLSYDFTFLSMFHMALSETPATFRVGRCPFRPTKKRAFCDRESTDALDYAADVAVILTYHKLADTVTDERSFKKVFAAFARAILKRDFKKAVHHRSLEAQWAQKFMEAQAAIERENSDFIDAAAHPTAEFLSRLASVGIVDDDVRYTAERFGYGLGRFIYLCDAAEDAPDDAKRRRFNVFVNRDPQGFQGDKVSDEAKEYITQCLHQTVAFCTEYYEHLPIQQFDSILRNIIYAGMPSTIHRLYHSAQEEPKV